MAGDSDPTNAQLMRTTPTSTRIRAPHVPPVGTRRGVVLLLVLSAIVVAAVLAYAMLAAASLDAQGSAHARAAVQAESMAENGVNLAMHYLLHPADSPVALIQGGHGDWHYPGQTNLALGDDSLDVIVTNVDPGTFRIDSVGRSRDADGAICTRQLRVQVVGVGDWEAAGAALFTGNVQLDPDVQVNGNLVTDGSYLGGGTVTGTKRAANYTSHVGDATWAAPPLPPEVTVPSFAALNLVRAANERGGWYAYNGSRCRADVITSTPLTASPTPGANNAGRVFVYDGTEPLVLAGSAPTDFAGTLVVTRADLVLTQQWRFLPVSAMPGLLVAGTTTLSGPGSRLNVDGIFYCGDGFGASSTLVATPVLVSGAFLYGGPSGPTIGANFVGAPTFTFAASKAAVPDLTYQGIRYKRLQIEDWEQVN